MTALTLIGLNHRTAPIELREKLHFSADQTHGAENRLMLLCSDCGAAENEAIILSTCNRTEIYLFGPPDIAAAADRFLAEHASIDPSTLSAHTYRITGDDAVRHLMRVACGLDSLVIGEDEILGQVKAAYIQSGEGGGCGPVLSGLFRSAIRCGKRARAETEIGCLRRSVAAIVVELALEIYPNLANRRALLIGAGKISAMTARGLTQAGLRCILVANRTYERALKLAARFGGQAVHFDSLPDVLADADIVICSTGAPHTVLHPAAVKAAMRLRPQRPILIADLAVPRDVEPAVGSIPGVHLVDIDDLDAHARRSSLNTGARECAEAIVEEEVGEFCAWLRQRRYTTLIAAIQERAEAICQAQTSKTARRLGNLAGEERKTIEAMAHSITAQLLHDPLMFIRMQAEEHPDEDISDLIREVFRLN